MNNSLIDFYNTYDDVAGQKIFEAEHLGKYVPERKTFKWNPDCDIREDSYINVKYIRNLSSESLYLKLLEQRYLYEGLKTSSSIEEMIAKLQSFEEKELIHSVTKESPFFIFNPDKTPEITFFMEKYIYEHKEEDEYADKLYKNMMLSIRLMGYFVANTSEGKLKGTDGEQYDVVWFTVHPKYIVEVTDQIYNNTDGILYHLTLRRNKEKILKNGFIPRNSKSYVDNYPDRVYLFTRMPPDNFQARVDEFATTRKKQYRKILEQARDDYNTGKISKEKYNYIVNHRYDYRDWIIVEVNIKDHRSYIPGDKVTQYRFFDDPRCAGIFTYENIDPLCINIIGDVTMSTDTDDYEEFKPIK